MPERLLEGIQITETPGAEQPIARASAHLTAFVGRTLRGPVNRAITVHSFADFQQQFGREGARSVADYIAGMTDRYALREHRRLFAIEES